MLSHLKLLLTACLFICLHANVSFAGSATGTGAISISYQGSCSLESAQTSVIYTGSADGYSPMDIVSTCSNGLPWSLSIDSGQYPLGQVRQAKSSAGYLKYRIFKDAGRAQEITIASNTVGSGIGIGAAQTSTVYVFALVADNPFLTTQNGTYTDIVQITINY